MQEKPLNVLLVFGHRRKLGAVRMVVPLEKALKTHGVHLFFAVENIEDFAGHPELTDRMLAVNGLTKWRSLRGKLAAAPLILRLLRFLKKSAVDVIYVHHLAAFPYALAASKLASVPHAVAVRNVYGETSRYRKLLLHKADNIIAVSEYMMGVVNGLLGKDSRIGRFVVHNGIDVDAFVSDAEADRIPAALQPPAGNVVVGMVSAMDKEKDPQFLLETARLVADAEAAVTFLCVGRFPDAGYEAETKALARRLGLQERVIFAGWHKNISSFFAAFDILAHPSPRRPEPFGLVLIEAMAHAKPIVSVRAGGIPEIVRHDETGLLCTPGNKKEFSEALLKLIRDPALRRRLGARGSDRVRREFSIEKTAASMAEVFRTIAEASQEKR
jgi:hypothetical protein